MPAGGTCKGLAAGAVLIFSAATGDFDGAYEGCLGGTDVGRYLFGVSTVGPDLSGAYEGVVSGSLSGPDSMECAEVSTES